MGPKNFVGVLYGHGVTLRFMQVIILKQIANVADCYINR